MSRRKARQTWDHRVFVGDFETTVYEGQVSTEVWASAIVELNTEDVKVHHRISDTWEYLLSLGDPESHQEIIVYYHNLKFDGQFWLTYLLQEGYHEAWNETEGFLKDKYLNDGDMTYVISDMGAWYRIRIKVNSRLLIDIRDSLKLMPTSVKALGKGFRTKHQKLDMEYTGLRYAGCDISPEELEYIKNDVLVVKEALEVMFSEGHDKLTIGSCALTEYKETINDMNPRLYQKLFPNLYDIQLDNSLHNYGSETVDEWIRKSYHGGWTYVVEGKASQVKHNGIVADVNSLYPSVMSSESGGYYPVGKPYITPGWFYEHPDYDSSYHFYFIRFRCGFTLKKGYLPFVQIKHNPLYKGNEMLKDSRLLIEGELVTEYWLGEDYYNTDETELTMSEVDWRRFQEFYEIRNLKVLDCIFFRKYKGIFDAYINKYRKMKMENKGAKRQIAKLFLNNLYGKFATSNESSYKKAELLDNGALHFQTYKAYDKRPGFIAIGSAITSYARDFTIRAAQKNYHGDEQPGFIYADTDSIHCDLSEEDLIDVPVHESAFCHWKIENHWDDAIFVRQKTYIEHVILEDGEPCEPFFEVKCAGMGGRCKELLAASLEGRHINTKNPEEEKFISIKRTLTDFHEGLTVPSKLVPRNIPGGILLVDTTFTLTGAKYISRF